ncbi:cysteine rich repeat-containing protein [Methylocystis sp. JAN1]|uniref:cysteine rich repeat-containing protein n=1 Tax=Methylocystis sp. JAN1 TaxID=3397211 RepID=UPI003FA2EE37
MNARCLALAIIPLSLLTVAQPAVALDSAVLTYCKDDVERLCAGVQMGGGRILQCLKSHKEQMSVGCAQGLQKMKKGMGK